MECLALATSALSDVALAAEVTRLVGREREVTAQLVAALAEFDARRLYFPAGCSSMFSYCTQVLHLSEHAAYNRIEAAQAARRYPVLLEHLATGDLTLTAVRLLSPHLTDANQQKLVAAARHKTKQALEQLVAGLRPQPDAPATIRRLPVTPPKHTVATDPEDRAPLMRPEAPTEVTINQTSSLPDRSAALARAAVVAPLAPERYRVQLTISRETHEKLRRAQELLRHAMPSGDLETIFDRAITLLLSDLEKRKCGAVQRPHNPELGGPASAGGSRSIPAAVRREVWARDEGRCAFVGSTGRCQERGWLEFPHVIPYADGGGATADNIELRCRRHNQYEAELWSGAVETAGAGDHGGRSERI